MSSYIYHGPWINWSHGLISGATITLGQQKGGLLTAFIATFVTVVGVQLWQIICYIIHQLRSVQQPQDGLYHQQQVIFRTYRTPGTATKAFLHQAWSWNGKARLSLLRTAPLAVFAFSYTIAVGLIAIYSSEISKSPGPQRLLIGQCGLWTAENSTLGDIAYMSKLANDTLKAVSYARACYNGNFDPGKCSRYSVSALDWNINRNVTCPFTSEMCSFSGTAAAVNMTTKLLDSNGDFGINAPAHARVQVQKTTSCAPITREGYAEEKNRTTQTETGAITETFFYYNYGSVVNYDGSIISNETTSYYVGQGNPSAYSLESYNKEADNIFGGFQPVLGLQKSDADISIIFISGHSVAYANPVDDPIFAAHDQLITSIDTGMNLYRSDAAVAVLGCSEQYRVCNPTNGRCTPFLGNFQLRSTLQTDRYGLDLTSQQNATALRLSYQAQFTSQYVVTFTRGAGSLRASETIVSYMQLIQLPPNHWQSEVSGWFDTGLALWQAGVQEIAANTASSIPGSTFTQYTDPSTAPELRDFCSSQVIKDGSGTVSFSVLGLTILLVLGGIIILVSLTIDTILGFIQQKTSRGLHKRMEWLVNDQLQTHMMLMRELRLGQWSSGPIKGVPTTNGGTQKFWGPAEPELRALGGSWGSEGETGIHLIQHERANEQDSKGWSARQGSSHGTL